MEKKEKTSSQIFHTFLRKQMLLSNGLSNGIINGLLYWAITRDVSSNLNYLYGTLLTNAILGIIVVILYPILIQYYLKKKPAFKIPYRREDHLLASIYPKNRILIAIINLIVGFVLTTIITMGIVGCCNLSSINVAWGAVIRGLDCAIFSIIAYYLSIVFVGTRINSSNL
jgi:hypothetical protein